MVLAVVLVAGAPLVDSASRSAQVRFGTIVAFVWIPVSGLVAVFGRRTHLRSLDVVELAIDLGLLALVQVVLGPGPEVFVLTHLLLVAYYTYLGGRRLGLVAGAAGFVLVAVVARHGAHDVDGIAVAVYPIMVAALIWLLDTAATERSRATDRVVRLRTKSDAILTGVAEAVMVTSPAGRVDQWNRAAEHTFSCSYDQAHRRPCSDVLGLHLGVRELDCSAGCALLGLGEAAEDNPYGDVEVWRTARTGQRQPLLASAQPVLDRAGSVVEVVHSFRDITKLKQADEAKTLFLATASHELKTPLTVIRGFTQMLLLPDSSMNAAEQDAALRAVDRRAGQLNTIVDRLLLSSRIEAGRIDLVPEPVDVVPIITELVTSWRNSSSRALSLDVAGVVPQIWADPVAFATVVDHLLDNAVKYSPGGGPVSVVAVVGDDHVEVVVADEGVGMTQEQAARCFDRFWQAEPTDVRRFGGSGIGLYIVRSLVEAMGGRISVSAAAGEGSTFTVELVRADRLRADAADEPDAETGRGDRSIIREYMRQLGVPVEAQR